MAVTTRTKTTIIGTEKALSQSPAVGSPSANPRSGQFQMVGTAVSMSRNSIQSPSANPKEGTRTLIGDAVKMSRAAVKGWGDAAHMVPSDRAIKMNQTAGVSGSRKRR